MAYLKADEVARAYRVARSTVYEWARDPEAIQRGVAVWMGERVVRFDAEKLEAWHRERSLRLRGVTPKRGRPRKGVAV